jgi:hypothetical protein
MCSHLPKGWEYFHETPVKEIFVSVQNDPEHGRRQPDGVFRGTSDVKHVMVDFTRKYGWGASTLLKLEDNKRAMYAELLGKLCTHHALVEFFPLACGYNGALEVDTWISLMNCPELRPKA